MKVTIIGTIWDNRKYKNQGDKKGVGGVMGALGKIDPIITFIGKKKFI